MKIAVKVLFSFFVAGASYAASFRVDILVVNGTIRIVADEPQGEISEIWYAVDSNGDGVFSDEIKVPYSGPVVINTLDLMAGRYALKAGAANQEGETATDTDHFDHIRLTMPPVMYAVEDQKTEIYFNNIMNSTQKEVSEFNVEINAGTLTAEADDYCWSLTPESGDAGSYVLIVSVRDDQNRLLAAVTNRLHIAPADAGDDQEVTLLVVGDSLTAAGTYPARIAERLNQPGNPKWEMQGKVSAENGAFHEGYGGNTWKRFVEGFPAKPGYSPFFYSQLDFERYLEKNEDGRKPDIITVNLGINDNFAASASVPTLASINESIDTMFIWATRLIAEFRSVCPDAEIGIGITTPANTRPGAFHSNYGNADRAWNWKHVVRIVDERIIAEYRDREDEGLYLIPSHLGLDDFQGFPGNNALHPNAVGYNQMGDGFYAWLKWRMEERANNSSGR